MQIITTSPTVLNASYEENNLSNLNIESKLDDKFFHFLHINSIKIYENIIKICQLFNSFPSTLSISVGSQLILVKHINLDQSGLTIKKTSIDQNTSNNIEIYLSKSLIDIIEKNKPILDDYLILDILLELYIKSYSFRKCINENCQDFHLNLITCLNNYFKNYQNEQKNHKYLELLLDIIFVHYYFNRKVSNY
jgi:hypothetical protein